MTLLKALSSKEKMYKNMFVVARNPKELIAPRSTFGLGNDSQQWINYLEKYAEPVE